MNWKKVLVPLVVIALGVVSMVTLINMREEPPKKEKELRAKLVDAIVVQPAEVQPQLTAYGRVNTAQPVVLISEVAGQLEQGTIPFKPAQSFKKGDLIVKVDDRLARLNLNSLKSDLLNAMASVLPDIKVDFPQQFTIWDTYFSNTTFDKPVAALPEVKDKKLKLYLSRSNVFKLFYAIKQAEINLQKHYFYAPFNGSIISADLRVGSTARGGTRLGEIINLDDLEVEIPIPSEEIVFINRNAYVQFFSEETGATWQGKINRVSQNIDDRTQSITAYVSLKNADNLPNGIFLSAAIPGTVISNAVLVPRQALYNEQFVYLIKDKQLYYQQVDIAFRQQESVIVTSGLAAGDTLVVELMQGIAPGMSARARLLTVDEGVGQ